MENVEKTFSKTSINWYPGHMAKTKREIQEKINLIDVIYEVIDSRMPLSSKIIDIDNLIKNKPRIVVFTKYDLCDQEETNKFVKHYESLGYKVLCCDLINNKNVVNKIIEESNIILKDMNEKRKEKGLKPRAIRALVIGVPNVGKSTLINRLVGKKAAAIGDKPGVTKSLSWIRINKDIELLDSPGILWPKFENQQHAYNLASLSSIKEEILDPYQLSVHILKMMYQLYPENLKNRYGIETIDFDDIIPTLDTIAIKRGALLKGGEKDYDKVYSIIIRDLKDNLLGKVTFDRIEELEN